MTCYLTLEPPEVCDSPSYCWECLEASGVDSCNVEGGYTLCVEGVSHTEVMALVGNTFTAVTHWSPF